MPDSLAELQASFAAHIRDPERNPPPPGIDDRRMGIYRDLFFRNLSSFLARSYRVVRSVYDEAGWQALIRDFFIEHRARTPLFPELPREFLHYLEAGRGERGGDPPFLRELAHYEWMEMALRIDEHDLDEVAAEAGGDPVAGVPVFSPLAWPLAYRFPVHRIGPDFQPAEAPPEPTHLLIYRNRSHRVRRMRLNAVAAMLVALLQEDRGIPGLDLLKELAARLGHPRPQAVLSHGADLLNELRERDVILGTRT